MAQIPKTTISRTKIRKSERKKRKRHKLPKNNAKRTTYVKKWRKA